LLAEDQSTGPVVFTTAADTDADDDEVDDDDPPQA